MISKLKFAFLTLLFIGLNSCKDAAKTETDTSSEDTTENTTTEVDMHTSETSLDWDGTYTGTLPCADCEGIETSLTLNQDLTFVLQTKYLGKDELTHETKGVFTWNDAGTEITLPEDGDVARSYKVGENRIWHLDNDGNPITNDLAEFYILNKS